MRRKNQAISRRRSEKTSTRPWLCRCGRGASREPARVGAVRGTDPGTVARGQSRRAGVENPAARPGRGGVLQ